MGKFTISTGSFSIATLNYQRVPPTVGMCCEIGRRRISECVFCFLLVILCMSMLGYLGGWTLQQTNVAVENVPFIYRRFTVDSPIKMVNVSLLEGMNNICNYPVARVAIMKDQDETSLMSTIIKYTMMKKDFAADTSVVLMLSKKYWCTKPEFQRLDGKVIEKSYFPSFHELEDANKRCHQFFPLETPPHREDGETPRLGGSGSGRRMGWVMISIGKTLKPPGSDQKGALKCIHGNGLPSGND